MDFQKVLADLNKLDQQGLVKVSNSGNFIFGFSLKNKLSLKYRTADKAYKYEVFEETYSDDTFQNILNYDDPNELKPSFALLDGKDPNFISSLKSALRSDLDFLIIASSKTQSNAELLSSIADPQFKNTVIPIILLV